MPSTSTPSATTPTTTDTTAADTTAADTTAADTGRQRLRLRLPHTRDEVFAASTVVLAAVALLLTATGRYDLGSVVSLAAVLLGGSSQLVSETRFERWESVCATVVAAVLLAVCLANGSGIFTTTAVMDA